MSTSIRVFVAARPAARACVSLLFVLGCASDADRGRHDAAAAPDAAVRDAGAHADAAAPEPAPALDDAPAVAAFRAALEQGRYDDLPDVLAELTDAAQAQPDDPDITLALALANLWGVAESGRAAEPDPGQQASHAFAAEMHLERARALAPDDARIDGWLGSVHIGIGLKTGNPELVQTGYDEIARGVERDPAFNLFVEAFQYAREDPSDPEFARAADAFFRTAELCEFGVSRRHPRLPEGAHAPPGVSPVCGNGPKMHHNIEGFWIYGGDILLKSGEVEVALALYENAAQVEGSRRWPHRDVVEQRLADAGARAERLSDGDAENDPLLAWDSPNQCVLCHAR